MKKLLMKISSFQEQKIRLINSSTHTNSLSIHFMLQLPELSETFISLKLQKIIP